MKVTTLQPKNTVHRKLAIAVVVTAQIDPNDARNCFVGDWNDGSNNRCSALMTINGTSKLICKHYNNPDVHGIINRISAGTNRRSIIHTPTGEIALWGQKEPIRRCDGCVVGERTYRSSNK